MEVGFDLAISHNLSVSDKATSYLYLFGWDDLSAFGSSLGLSLLQDLLDFDLRKQANGVDVNSQLPITHI